MSSPEAVAPTRTDRCVVAKCCCCIELKFGCFIIGTLDLIYTAYRIFKSVELIYKNNDTTIVIVGTSVTLLFAILYAAFATCMLIGLHQEKPDYVKYYLMFAVFQMVVVIPLTIAFVNIYLRKSTHNIAISNCNIMVFYFFFVVRSQYFVMTSPEERPRRFWGLFIG